MEPAPSSGLAFDLSSTVTVKDAIEIVVVRSAATRSWVTREVKSGSTLATQADKSVVKSTFDKVLFKASETDPCMPASGTISGKVFASTEDAADDAKATKSYTITFANGVASMAVDGGAAEEMDDYKPQCDLAD